MTSTPSDCFPFENPCAPGNNIGFTAVSVEPGNNTISKDVGFKYFIGIEHADKLKDFYCTVDRQGKLNIKYNYISHFDNTNTDLQGTDLIKYEEVVFPAGQFGNLEISPDTTVLIKINDLKSSDSLRNQLCIKLENIKDALPESNKKEFTFSYVNPKKKENSNAVPKSNETVKQGKDTAWWIGTIIIITFVLVVLFFLIRFLTRRRY
jgi:hypothetical protein